VGYWSILTVFLPIFLIIGLGWSLRRGGILTVEADASLLRLVVLVFSPCLIFDSVVGNPLLRVWQNVIVSMGLGALTIALGLGIAAGAGWLGGIRGEKSLRTFAFGAGLYNYGYIAIPIVQACFGKEEIGLLMVFNVGVELSLWTLGMAVFTGNSLSDWRRIVNPPAIAVFLALAGNAAHAAEWIPPFAMKAVHSLGLIAVPMALLLVGATAAELAGNTIPIRPYRAAALGVLVRLAVIPAVFLALVAVLPIPVELRRVLVVQAAMPSAMITVVLTRVYGGDVRVALAVTTATSLVSLFSAPLVIAWGLRIAGG